MKSHSVSLLVPITAGLLLGGCTAAELEQFRSNMTTPSESGPGIPSDGISEAAAKAQGVAIGQLVQGSLSRVGEQDEYRINGEAGQELMIYFQPLNGKNLLQQRLTLLNTTGNAELARVDAEGVHKSLQEAHSRTLTLKESGPHIIRVGTYFDADADRIGPYRFQIVPINPAPERLAPMVTPGQIVSGEALDHPGDYDVFTFQGRAGQKVMLHFQPLNGKGLLQQKITLRGSANDAVLAVVDATGTQQTLDEAHSPVVTLPETGTYRVRVETYFDADGERLGAYRFQVRPMP